MNLQSPLTPHLDKKRLFLSSKISFEVKHLEDTTPPQLTQYSTLHSMGKTADSFNQTGLKHKSMVNIFDEINNTERQKYNDCNAGPRYKEGDNLVKWSIVGRPEQFLKVQNRKKGQPRAAMNTKKIDPKLDQSLDEPELAPQKPLQNQPSMLAILDPNKQKKTTKKIRGDYKMIKKEELLIKMVDTKSRLDMNKMLQTQSEEKLPLNLRNIVSREQRVMENFKDTVEKWDLVNNQVASNCEREPTHTILMRSDQFRDRVQKVHALESLKNDQEKFNNRLWYMRLRSYEQPTKDNRPQFNLIPSLKPKTSPYQTRIVNRFVKDYENERLAQQEAYILSDIQNNFGTKIIDNPHAQVETVIAEPSSDVAYNRQCASSLQQGIQGFDVEPTERGVEEESGEQKGGGFEEEGGGLQRVHQRDGQERILERAGVHQEGHSGGVPVLRARHGRVRGDRQHVERAASGEDRRAFLSEIFMIIQQNLCANATQTELCHLFQTYIAGMKRLDKCLDFIATNCTAEYVPTFFLNGSLLKPFMLQEYLLPFGIAIEPYEAQDLLSRLGGSDWLTLQELQEFLLPFQGPLKPTAEMAYLRLLHEEIKLEKAADEQRLRIMRRWDYNCESLFRKLALNSVVVDFQRFKKFFIRMRVPVTDTEIELLIRRVGNCETKCMNFVDFSLSMKTQRQRVSERASVAPPPKLLVQSVSKVQVGYMEKLRMKYNLPIQGQKRIRINTPQTPRNQSHNRAATPQSTKTEPKAGRPRTPNQNTEPRYVSVYQETKELNSLMSLYLNQQRCLQNVLAQLEDVRQLKSLEKGKWEEDWMAFSVNARGVSYERFMDILHHYDNRKPLEARLQIKQLSNPALTMADNLFDLIRDQDHQLSKAKLQFLRDGSLSVFDRYFVKGHMDVLDVLQVLETASSSSVSLEDAELLIARITNFNGEKVIRRKILLNELT